MKSATIRYSAAIIFVIAFPGSSSAQQATLEATATVNGGAASCSIDLNAAGTDLILDFGDYDSVAGNTAGGQFTVGCTGVTSVDVTLLSDSSSTDHFELVGDENGDILPYTIILNGNTPATPNNSVTLGANGATGVPVQGTISSDLNPTSLNYSDLVTIEVSA